MWNRNVNVVVLVLVFFFVYIEAQTSTESPETSKRLNGVQMLESTNHVGRRWRHRKSSSHHVNSRHGPSFMSRRRPRPRRLQTLRAHLKAHLNARQRRHFFRVMRKDQDVTKGVHKSKLLNRFVNELSSKQQKRIQLKHQQALHAHKQRQQTTTRKLKKLSSGARSLFGRFNKIANDDSITKPTEQKKIHAVLKQSDKSVIHELKRARVELPGVTPHRRKHRQRGLHGKRTKLHKSRSRLDVGGKSKAESNSRNFKTARNK